MTDHAPDRSREPEDGSAGDGPHGAGGAPPSDAQAAGEELVGRVLAGRYRILRLLGVGAMGSVYLGEHLNFGRKDAIKVLHPSMARDPEAKKRFLRGARNVSAINHPNVCTVYDFSDTDDGLQFLAMEFVEGEPLSDTLERDGALPVARAVGIVEQVAAALQAAHDQDIVHRDLKPGNIMLTRARDGSDLAKVVDFDIAKGSREGEGSEVTRMGFVVGTPEYMSLEQLTGDPLDGRSDIYSLGLVLFRLLTGRLPMRAGSTKDLLVERLTQDPLTLREVDAALEVPPELQAVLDRALQRRREDRYPTASAFAAHLVEAATRAVGPGQTAGDASRATAAAAGSAPSGPSAPARPELPATRVSDPGAAPAPAGARSGASESRGRRRVVAWGVGGVAVVAALSWGAYAALTGGNGTSAGESATAGEGALPTGAAGGQDPGGAHETATVGGGGGDVAAGGATDTAGDRETVAAANRPTGDPTGGAEEGDPTGGGADQLPFAAAAAEDVVFRQFNSLMAGAASPGLLEAAADTAALIVDMAGASTSARAVAAFILGDVSATRGDTAAAVRWLERSLEIDPGQQAPRTLLRTLRGGRP